MNKFANLNKENILYITVAVGMVFLIFYWSHLFLQGKIETMKQDISTIENKIVEVEQLAKMAKNNRNRTSELTTGLLSFVQDIGRITNIEEKIISVQPKPTNNYTEAVTFKVENMNLNELINLIQNIDDYSNIVVTSITIEKRFDNPNLANLSVEMGKK
jgi:hypothetical protein